MREITQELVTIEAVIQHELFHSVEIVSEITVRIQNQLEYAGL